MDIIKWRDGYATGVEEMDLQHKSVIDMINQLYRLIRDHKSQEDISEILEVCITYSMTHLREEEDLLEKYDYPDLEDQQESHQEFTTTINGLNSKLGEDPEVVLELYQYLRTWWLGHIVGKDKLYGPFLNEKGVL